MNRIVIPFLMIVALLFGCQRKTNTKVFENKIEIVRDSNLAARKDIQLKAPARIKAKAFGMSEWDTVSGTFECYQYILYPRGRISLQMNGVTRNIKLKAQDFISEAYFYRYNDNLIIFYTDTDMDASASFVECFDKNFQLKWKQYAGGFNLTNPAILDSISYIASVGFICKLNLDNGKYVWEYNNLYDTTRFDYFRSIGFDGENVTFYGPHGNGMVVLNDKTGQIIEIYPKTISKR